MSSSNAESFALPPPRRVVTNTSDKGKAQVWMDDQVTMYPFPGSAMSGGHAWMTESSPADAETKVDAATLTPPGIVHPAGSVIRFLDMPPGSSFPPHFTDSIDYGIIVHGEATLHLDDGASALLKTGDVLIQLGNVHGWENRSDTVPVRMVGVVLPSKAIEINGKPLEGLHL
ncbi:cupin domain protein [Leucosporidium creatinivorum]|uniref:Cupin domain protein n=1 Tax=Leucosporidium creatinivorum TaxID=106004 RepID=A0A1Y2FPR1_9BASI|nr:cupin domain protein [Leucosporidium creatinivorum]